MEEIYEKVELSDDEDDKKEEEQNKAGKKEIFSNINKKKSYTIEMKLKFHSLADMKSDHYVEDNYGMDRKNLRRWRDQKDILLTLENKKKYRIPGGGRKTYLAAEEEGI